MRTAIPRIYCGVADLQMDPFVGISDFRRSVLTNLLFYGDLAITDGFWFMTSKIASELRRDSRDNVLTAGLTGGYIRPYFRAGIDGSFKQAYDVISSQGIVGLVDGSRDVALLLDRIVERAPRYRYSHWPKRMVGKGFHQIVTERLNGDPSINSRYGRQLWEATRPWRTQCVQEALARSNDGTLRRGELLDVVARTLGWDTKEKMPNSATLVDMTSGKTRRYLRHFLYWVNQCYQENQSLMFRLKSGIPTGVSWDQLAYFPRTPSRWCSTPLDVLEFTECIPSIALLAHISPTAIINVRRSPEGRFYFQQFAKWRTDPTDCNAEEFGKALSLYTERLRKDYLKMLQEKVMEKLTVTLPRISLSEKQHWIGQAWECLGQTPVIGFAIFIGKCVWTNFKHYRVDSSEKFKETMLGVRREITLSYEKPCPRNDSGQLSESPSHIATAE